MAQKWNDGNILMAGSLNDTFNMAFEGANNALLADLRRAASVTGSSTNKNSSYSFGDLPIGGSGYNNTILFTPLISGTTYTDVQFFANSKVAVTTGSLYDACEGTSINGTLWSSGNNFVGSYSSFIETGGYAQVGCCSGTGSVYIATTGYSDNWFFWFSKSTVNEAGNWDARIYITSGTAECKVYDSSVQTGVLNESYGNIYLANGSWYRSFSGGAYVLGNGSTISSGKLMFNIDSAAITSNLVYWNVYHIKNGEVGSSYMTVSGIDLSFIPANCYVNSNTSLGESGVVINVSRDGGANYVTSQLGSIIPISSNVGSNLMLKFEFVGSTRYIFDYAATIMR